MEPPETKFKLPVLPVPVTVSLTVVNRERERVRAFIVGSDGNSIQNQVDY